MNDDSLITRVIALVAVLLIVGAINYGCAAATPESKAIKAAEDAGYTDVTVLDKAYVAVGLRGCGEQDNARFTVRGTNVRGETRTFYVYAGVLKGGTIRSK